MENSNAELTVEEIVKLAVEEFVRLSKPETPVTLKDFSTDDLVGEIVRRCGTLDRFFDPSSGNYVIVGKLSVTDSEFRFSLTEE